MLASRCFSKLRGLMELNKTILRGIVFDLDGTLTIPCLDFKQLKKQLQIESNVDILGHVATLSGDEKSEAMAIIESFEAEGRDNLKLQPGIDELFQFLTEKIKINLALLTRNDLNSVNHFFSKCREFGISNLTNDTFSIILTRDFKPVKPDPAPVLHIASQWSISPNEIIVVGDGEFDILCGQRAGSTTVLLNNHKNMESRKLADMNVDSLSDIIPIIQSHIPELKSEQ